MRKSATPGKDSAANLGIEGDIGPEHADIFRRDLHPDLRVDYVLANPAFNDPDWFANSHKAKRII